MKQTFRSAGKFTATGLDKWRTPLVTTMFSTFMGAASMNVALGAWDMSRVTKMSRCFQGAIVMNADLSSWDVSQVSSSLSVPLSLSYII